MTSLHGTPIGSTSEKTRLSDPRNRAKLFQDILNDLIQKRQKPTEQNEQPKSEYSRNFTNINQSTTNIEEVNNDDMHSLSYTNYMDLKIYFARKSRRIHSIDHRLSAIGALCRRQKHHLNKPTRSPSQMQNFLMPGSGDKSEIAKYAHSPKLCIYLLHAEILCGSE